jgi:hypothetical protein
VADALIVESTPPLAWYDTARPADIDLAWPRLVEIPEIAAELRIDGGETPSARVRLDNGDGALTGHLVAMPLRSPAAIRRDGAEVFRGLVVGIDLGADALIELEA